MLRWEYNVESNPTINLEKSIIFMNTSVSNLKRKEKNLGFQKKVSIHGAPLTLPQSKDSKENHQF